ncbi:carboxylesterase family protein [Colletotrichum scovillei]|uniref:Carboxylesterase family protein n=1 Tax=Colletotrichum scovillei TaxID=1209932 RepID=A0A9P7UGM7_9PEZI|nr:carboxylesterase family protein [Colletotrichum scovillei]KAG7060279.1 carboxylesterase family protein [Colletotrichum scovillei]KAG7067732.1 carboxylesterase family protein [Colletotrichum scovillei]
MGRLSRSNTVGHGFGILEDTSGPGNHASSDANGPHAFNNVAALEDCDTNSRQRTPEFIDALTDKLKELHIYSPKKNRADRSLLQPVRRRSTRSSIDSKIFPTLQHIREEVEICDGNSSVTSPTQGPVLANLPQETKQDEGIPSSTETRAAVPTSPRQTSDLFEANGSNFCSEVLRAIGLEQQHLNTNLNIQKSIKRHRSATPLIFDEASRSASNSSSENDDKMAVAEPLVRLASPAPAGYENPMTKSAINVSVVEQIHSKESSLDYVDHPKDRVVSFSSTDESRAPTEDVPRTPSRSTSTSSRSRIEDSVEAIDKLEEELEAINTRLATPSKSRRVQSVVEESTTTAPTRESPIRRPAPTLNRTQSVGAAAKGSSQARANQRKSVNFDSEVPKGSPGKAPTTRPPVPRPTSLLPPKPPAKSTRPPTKPSFELPGEATARDIKARRDARLAQQAQEKAAAAVPQRTRSLKAPTKPNFELPGEAISRRKREEREARLKQQEEEERKRREFKASPIKARLGTATQPRETVASRARQNKGSEASDMESPSKRSSIMGTPRTLARTSSTRSPQTRGRGTSQSGTETQLSRATSTSTGSMSGKRSALSVEEMEQQKVKGREVFHRDNSYTQDKERERREREWNAKMAREQAAERSRQASREWREKQQRSKLAILAAAAGQTV